MNSFAFVLSAPAHAPACPRRPGAEEEAASDRFGLVGVASVESRSVVKWPTQIHVKNYKGGDSHLILVGTVPYNPSLARVLILVYLVSKGTGTLPQSRPHLLQNLADFLQNAWFLRLLVLLKNHISF